MENIFIRSNYFSNQSTKHNAEKTSKFEWMLDDTRIEKIISDPIWATFFSFLFFFFFFFFLGFSFSDLICPFPLPLFFHGFYLYQQLDHVPSYHPMQFPAKLMNQLNLILAPLVQIWVTNFFSKFYLYQMLEQLQLIIVCNFKKN